MKRKYLKVAATLMAATLIFSFAACTETEAPVSESNPAPAAVTSAVASTSEVPAEPVVSVEPSEEPVVSVEPETEQTENNPDSPETIVLDYSDLAAMDASVEALFYNATSQEEPIAVLEACATSIEYDEVDGFWIKYNFPNDIAVDVYPDNMDAFFEQFSQDETDGSTATTNSVFSIPKPYVVSQTIHMFQEDGTPNYAAIANFYQNPYAIEAEYYDLSREDLNDIYGKDYLDYAYENGYLPSEWPID